MGLSTVILGVVLAVLPLVAGGLLAALVLLERRDEPLAADAPTGRAEARPRLRDRKPGGSRRGRVT